MQSCLYRGTVRHRRFEPFERTFTYRMFMLYLDLDELPRVFQRRWLWSVEGRNLAAFRRADHLGDPDVPLIEAVRDLVERDTGTRPQGPVRLLTHLRYFGYVFNPVSFFYCFDAAGERVESIVADVGNTPWNERHPYVLGPRMDRSTGGDVRRYEFDKEFHVSPFHDMDTCYDWRFAVPGDGLTVQMECTRSGELFFDATLLMERREITGRSLAGALARHPFMTGKVVAGIYWQALLLWLRGAPVYDHPAKRARHGMAVR